MQYRKVMLIRCRPDAEGAAAMIAAARRQSESPSLLFFHGPGLEWAASEDACQRLSGLGEAVSLMLCAAGWHRRKGEEAPPAGWQAGSLIQFWDAADRAERVLSFGALRA